MRVTAKQLARALQEAARGQRLPVVVGSAQGEGFGSVHATIIAGEDGNDGVLLLFAYPPGEDVWASECPCLLCKPRE